MAEENPETPEIPEEADAPEAAEPATSLLVPLVNSIVLLGALGFLAYTRLVYKHPAITDDVEKARILASKDDLDETSSEGMGTVAFGPLTVNIMTSPDNTLPTGPNSPPSRGKMHYLATTFILEIRDKSQADMVKSLKPFILDKLIQLVGKKNFHELATVQGRYILHSQLIDVANQTIAARTHGGSKETMVSNLYFTQFLVQ